MTDLLRSIGAKVNCYSRPDSHFAGYLGHAPDVFVAQGFAPTPEATWSRIKADCDAVILPYQIGDAFQTGLYQTHFPSKLTEYAALGMPIIVVGEASHAGVAWATQNPGAAMALLAEKESEWSGQLRQLTDDAGLRRSLSERALDAGNRDFAAEPIRQAFLQRLWKLRAHTQGKPREVEVPAATREPQG
jgi:hypothetical protein